MEPKHSLAEATSWLGIAAIVFRVPKDCFLLLLSATRSVGAHHLGSDVDDLNSYSPANY